VEYKTYTRSQTGKLKNLYSVEMKQQSRWERPNETRVKTMDENQSESAREICSVIQNYEVT